MRSYLIINQITETIIIFNHLTIG